jgi:hypothetical protein
MADALSSESFLRVARVTHGTTAEGPNLRTALWVQGCSIRCKGCINPHLFSARGGTLVAPQMIIDEAIAAGDEGLTLLGGEPNQRFIHFSDRYADYDPARIPDRVDLRILPNGEVSIAGFLTAERVVELANALGARRSMRA